MARHGHRSTFKRLVRAHTAPARNADGSCNEQADALLDGDAISAIGTGSL